MLTRPCSVCGTISSVAGNGHSGLVSFGTMRVSASTPTSKRDGLGVDARLRRERARRPKLEPEIRQPGAGGAERDRAAELGPFAPRRLLEERIVAQPRLQPRDLLVDLPLQQRLHLVATR